MSNENEEGMTMGEALMKLGNSNVISKDCCKKVIGENSSYKIGFVQSRSISFKIRSKNGRFVQFSFNFVLNPFNFVLRVSGRPTKHSLVDRP